jgi:hypothetical protein
VEFVEDDGAEVGEQRIALEARRQHALGDDQQLRAIGELALETDLPADFAADRPPTFEGDARRDGPRRDAPRLQQDDRAVGRERRRYARRLAGPGRGGDDDPARAPQVGDDAL